MFLLPPFISLHFRTAMFSFIRFFLKKKVREVSFTLNMMNAYAHKMKEVYWNEFKFVAFKLYLLDLIWIWRKNIFPLQL